MITRARESKKRCQQFWIECGPFGRKIERRRRRHHTESSFTEDLDADSLDVVELIMAFEEEFSTDDNQVEISDDDAESIQTVQNAVDYLGGKGVTG